MALKAVQPCSVYSALRYFLNSKMVGRVQTRKTCNMQAMLADIFSRNCNIFKKQTFEYLG